MALYLLDSISFKALYDHRKAGYRQDYNYFSGKVLELYAIIKFTNLRLYNA
jgi:hypothetical protein